MSYITEDIREKPTLNHEAVVGLNFIRDPAVYFFRRHYRQGLRSHIMEVLKGVDVERERAGVEINGIKWFPRAKPKRMLRIFRSRFKRPEEALEEIRTVKIIERYLGPDHIAKSDEFLVDYMEGEKRDVILCGLQEYVEGEILDPWAPNTKTHLKGLLLRINKIQGLDSKLTTENLVQRARKQTERFIKGVKKMILEAGHVPDLAGAGNILLTPSGNIKLVDINNVSKVSFGSGIKVDDKGYPVCDTSIRALSLLEKKILDRPINMKEPIYHTFLNEQRMKQVKILQEKFNHSMAYR